MIYLFQVFLLSQMVIKIRYAYKFYIWFLFFAPLFPKVDFTVATLLALCFAERFLKGGFYSRYAFCSLFLKAI